MARAEDLEEFLKNSWNNQNFVSSSIPSSIEKIETKMNYERMWFNLKEKLLNELEGLEFSSNKIIEHMTRIEVEENKLNKSLFYKIEIND